MSSLHRQVNRVPYARYGTDRVARLVRDHNEAALRTAIDLHATANGTPTGGPTLEECLALMGRHDIQDLRNAVALSASGGANSDRPTVEGLATVIRAASA